jgi:hypothetical protein
MSLRSSGLQATVSTSRLFSSRGSNRWNKSPECDFSIQQGVSKMSTIFGLTIAVALMAGGVWANISDVGPLAQARGAWVSR